MVNIILAVILAGSVGFLAGHFFNSGNASAPLTPKEAVTGEEEPAPPTYSIPRPTESKAASAPSPGEKATKGPEKSKPVMCEQGSTLQEQMARLQFLELKKLCDEAERDWRSRHVDSFAPDPKDKNEREQARIGILQTLKEPMLTSAYWRGEATVNDGARSIHVEVFMNFYRSKDTEEVQNQRTTLNLVDPMELCYAFAPYFTVNGKLTEQAGSSVSQCGASLRKRGDTYYIHWNTLNSPELSPSMNVLLIPIPGSRQTSLEYLHTEKLQWVSESSFRWHPSSFQQTTDLRERYNKSLEERSR